MSNTTIDFVKMHGIGNDYVYIDCFNQEIKDPVALAVEMSRRHFNIGSDGLILIRPSDKADCFMDIYNADGSRGLMCGNGLRCVAKYMYEKQDKINPAIWIETLSGVRRAVVKEWCEQEALVSVHMGTADFRPWGLPESYLESQGFTPGSDSKVYGLAGINVGNAHCVIFCENPDTVDVTGIGSWVSTWRGFPETVNVEFVQVESPGSIRMRIWERGSGETLACGSGACAAVATCVKLGLVKNPVQVKLPGGELEITCNHDFRIDMIGPARTVYFGQYLF